MYLLMTAPHALTDGRREVLRRRIRWIVAATITYNVIEAVIALLAGRAATSAAGSAKSAFQAGSAAAGGGATDEPEVLAGTGEDDGGHGTKPGR